LRVQPIQADTVVLVSFKFEPYIGCRVALLRLIFFPGESIAPHRPSTESSRVALDGHEHSMPTQDSIADSHPHNSSDSQMDQSSTSLAEVKKKAQAAILDLWPFDMRYSNYLEEGVDESVLKALFGEMGLEIDHLTSGAGSHKLTTEPQRSSQKETEAKVSLGTEAAQTSPKNSHQSTGQKQNNLQNSSEKPAGKSEERKDRIARLLAAKGTKPTPSSSIPNNQPATSDSAESATKSSASKLPSKKDLLLQQKMEALQKSREARAKKAAERMESKAAYKDASGASSPNAQDSLPDASDTPNQPEASAEKTAQAVEDGPSNGQSKSPELGVTPPSASAPPIPGLFLQPNEKLASSLNPRKRPVASDFEDFSTTSYKRPFGHNRNDQPLVIDVSDGSDDEDIEMEIASPTDGPSMVPHAESPNRKTGSFRDYPPLTDRHSHGQFSSPVPIPGTPPIGPGQSTPSQHHLERMNKQIEDMKRRIALAEARKKAKQIIGTLPALPKSNGLTAEDSTDSGSEKPILRRVQSIGAFGDEDAATSENSLPMTSLKLPKTSLRLTRAQSDRDQRFRVTSQSLQVVEDALRAKRSKLKLLQSEIARLEKEVQDDTSEQQRLLDQVKALDSETFEEDKDSPSESISGICPPPLPSLLPPSLSSDFP
jgi:hypothetical protein